MSEENQAENQAEVKVPVKTGEAFIQFKDKPAVKIADIMDSGSILLQVDSPKKQEGIVNPNDGCLIFKQGDNELKIFIKNTND